MSFFSPRLLFLIFAPKDSLDVVFSPRSSVFVFALTGYFFMLFFCTKGFFGFLLFVFVPKDSLDDTLVPSLRIHQVEL